MNEPNGTDVPGIRPDGIVFVLLGQDRSVLMERCPKKAAIYGGEWFLPGGRTEPTDPSPEAALDREMQEELGCGPRIWAPMRLVDGGQPRAPFLIQPYLVQQWRGTIPARCLDRPDVPLRWVQLAEAQASPVYAVRSILTQIALPAPEVEDTPADGPEVLDLPWSTQSMDPHYPYLDHVVRDARGRIVATTTTLHEALRVIMVAALAAHAPR